MERIRRVTLIAWIVLAYLIPTEVEAKVLSCKATKDDGLGWIPREFRIDLANDRKTAQVISPVTEIFGAKPFEKSFLGSSLWSRGKGKSKMGDTYNYQLRLDLDSNDTEAKVVMRQQGYSDIELNFRCDEGTSKTVSGKDSSKVIRLENQTGKLLLDFEEKKLVIDGKHAVFDAMREEVKKTGIVRLAVTNISKSCSDTIWQDELPLVSVNANIIGSDIAVVGLDAVFKFDSDLANQISFFVTDTSNFGRWACRGFQTPLNDRQLFLSEVKSTVESKLLVDGWNQYTSLRTAEYTRNGREETTVVGYKARAVSDDGYEMKGFILLGNESCSFVSKNPMIRGAGDISVNCPSGYSVQIFFEGRGSGKGGFGIGSDINGDSIIFTIGPHKFDMLERFPRLVAQKKDSTRIAGIESKDADIDPSDVERHGDRLGVLEAEKHLKQKLIPRDTQQPNIRITDSSSEGARGIISGIATDNTGIAEVSVGGEIVPVDPFGHFTVSTFIPSSGIDIEIVAYDLKGLSTTETIRLERSQRTKSISRLAVVNPLIGPKQEPSPDRVALIIGVEKYARAPPADFASRDAQMFADYAREKLGIADNNIKVLTDTGATETEVLRALKVWLPKAVEPDTTDLYVFYAGHGMPTADGASAYLIPYDGDIQLLEDTAISRKRFFNEISATKPRSATFFFDNCFSGATRSEELLLASRPLGIKVQETNVPDNYLVFAAGETGQIAGVEPEVKHGRFSYFVFKGLEGEADANQDGKISAGELHAYVRESVGRFSAGAQTPTMLGDAGRWVLR